MNKQGLRHFENSLDRRKNLEKKLQINLLDITNFNFAEEAVQNKNIENLIGAVHIPLGVAGPVKIKNLNKSYYLPLATTEGALVASVSRGCKVISGLVNVYSENIGMTRGPVFEVKNLEQGLKLIKEINNSFAKLQALAAKSSKYLELTDFEHTVVGKNVFLRFIFETGSAMGMNMATIATAKIVEEIEQKLRVKCLSLAGNYDIDKKPGWINFINGRGRQVWAEAVTKKTVVKNVLKTTPEKIVDLVYKKCWLGGVVSGAMGFNAHFANVVSSIFIATGQDPAQVVEGSLGITSAEVLKSGDLYMSIFMPALLVGTIGGGTSLPSQKTALSLLKLENDSVEEFSKVVGAAVLAGELSLLASLTEGTLAKAHQSLGRGQK